MRIERIDEVLKIYDENFPKKYEMDPRLEFILAQALLVVIYSEFEKKVQKFGGGALFVGSRSVAGKLYK